MKKACFRLVIGLFCLTLVLTILAGKSAAQELNSCKGFMGYAIDSADNNKIGVFSDYSSASQCTLKNLNCDQARVLTLKDNKCHHLTRQTIDFGEGQSITDCEPDKELASSACNRLCICEDLLDIKGKGCWEAKNADSCIKNVHDKCVTGLGFKDGEQFITPEKFKEITTCIQDAIKQFFNEQNKPTVSQTTYDWESVFKYTQNECAANFGTGTAAAANITSCSSAAYKKCTDEIEGFKENNTLDEAQFGIFKKCISAYIADLLPTIYNKSQLLTYAQGRCVANFGGGAGSTIDVNRCSADTYDQCGASVNSGKKLDDKSTLNQTQYDNYKICVDSTIAKKKSTTKKIITGSELYWEINPSTRTSKKISISTVANVDLDQIDPSANIVGEQGKNYVMTLYLWFNGYSGECTDSTPITFCKIIRFTIHYTPAAYSTSGRSLEVGGTCIAGTPKFVPESCTHRCKAAGCAKGKGEGSVRVCQADGKSYGASIGVCVQECKDSCSQDPAGLDVTNAPDCNYNEPCQDNGIKTCTEGKFINNKCIYVDGKTKCGECKLPTKTGGCTLGAYDVRCKGECGGCNSDAGKAKVYQCNSSGIWDLKYEECNQKCAQYCGGSSSGPKEGDGCTYPEPCPAGGVHTCTGTVQGGVCKYNPAVNPACGDCK